MPDLGGGHLEYLQLLNSCPLQLLEMVGQEGVSLTTVLTIHHQALALLHRLHGPHSGNAEWPRLVVLVLGDKHICVLTHRLAHGKELLVSTHLGCLPHPADPLQQFGAIHMCYFLWEDERPNVPAVFSRNLLSVAGCSWHLESMAQQIYQSLLETLGTLPREMLCASSAFLQEVFCGHEHTLDNLKFVEPCNVHVRAGGWED
ncbi:PREDICTED: LOW QUALITY PROTEIN: hydroxyacylglutathione hydrolase-like protein [Miniopterus natalensis]|uniref:LOW QUALITY PROTEIN: hydroxyacylglutathione hydrolase-like protein n=1 Tax=Miniopterus natalensis TaxID=291302 RepID=UPI0007A6AAED|nr:PREDICTED: LOW QUALITY PROTEIN: hydroxyacylglutathione hydrolase-like protein [Miniopterus natalensis]